MERLERGFFLRDVLEVAPDLLGCRLFRKFNNGSIRSYVLTEVEAYRGVSDLACHASRGRTKRTEVMYREGGMLYMYMIYGMYWMMNIVTSGKNNPQAVLIRGLQGISGPGKLSGQLELDGGFYGEDLTQSDRIWIVNRDGPVSYNTTPRINIDYAPEPWRSKPWRFFPGE